MFSIGNKDLDVLPALGETVTCWMCGQEHSVQYGEKIVEDGTRQPDNLLAFFKCGEQSYLCGIKGKRLKPPKETVQHLDEYNQPISRDSDHIPDVGKMVSDRPLGDPEIAIEILKQRVVELETAIRRLADQDATLSVCDGNVTVTMDATFTDTEREAIHQAAIRLESLCQIGSQQRAATLRGLLERLGAANE